MNTTLEPPRRAVTVKKHFEEKTPPAEADPVVRTRDLHLYYGAERGPFRHLDGFSAQAR